MNENLKKRIWDLELKHKYLCDKITCVENSLEVLNWGLRCTQTKSTAENTPEKEPFHHRLINSITAVGLKEIVGSKTLMIKISWTVLFLAGLFGTVACIYRTTKEFLADPTATKIYMDSKPSYEYPTLALCPEQWIDEAKIQQIGLSEEALKYALAYTSKSKLLKVENVTKVHDEFLHAYSSNNFTSLLDFYEKIALEFPILLDSIEFNRESLGIYQDEEIDYLGPGFLHYGVCQFFNLSPAKVSDLDTSIDIYAKHPLSKSPRVQNVNDWFLHIDVNQEFLTSLYPGTSISTGHEAMITIQGERYVIIDQPDKPCVDPQMKRKDYSFNTCFVNCQNRYQVRDLGCQHFHFSLANESKGPQEYCNSLEVYENGTTLSKYLKILKYKKSDPEATKRCMEQCPTKCDRIVYQAFHEWTKQWVDDASVIQENQSRIKVRIKHFALYDGGIWTVQEVRTYSAMDWVTNIGGCFGLFIGGTVLTLFQILLFFVDYILGKTAYKTAYDINDQQGNTKF